MAVSGQAYANFEFYTFSDKNRAAILTEFLLPRSESVQSIAARRGVVFLLAGDHEGMAASAAIEVRKE